MTTIELVGVDGSRWDLMGGPVRLKTGGMKGLGLPDMEERTTQSAAQDGQTFRGWTAKPRTVWLPLRFDGAANADPEGVQRAFWRAAEVGEYVTLRVTDRTGYPRELRMRLVSDGGMPYRLDPSTLTDAFGLTFTADAPWWEGPEVTTTFGLDEAQASFFGDGAPDFVISPSEGGTTRQIANPGDRPAWVRWVLVGDIARFSIGLGGRWLAGAIPMSPGVPLVLETDPRRQIAYRGMTADKVTRLLDSADWAPVPRRSTATVELLIVGTGVVTGSFRPRYTRGI